MKKYLRIDHRWQRYNKELDKVSLDDLDKALDSEYIKRTIISPVERNSKLMQKEINVLLKHFKDLDNIDVLEAGGGYGNFCRIFQKNVKVKSYTILDTKSMLRFAKAFLKKHSVDCNFVAVEEFEILFDKKFDLFVSNICLSEVPDYYRKILLNKILPNCKKLYVIDVMLNDLKEAMEGYFDKIDIIGLLKNHYCFIGEKL